MALSEWVCVRQSNEHGLIKQLVHDNPFLVGRGITDEGGVELFIALQQRR